MGYIVFAVIVLVIGVWALRERHNLRARHALRTNTNSAETRSAEQDPYTVNSYGLAPLNGMPVNHVIMKRED